MIKKLSALLVDPQIATRSRLKEAIKSFVLRASITQVRSLKEAQQKLEVSEPFDVIFLSSQSSKEELLKAVTDLRTSQHIRGARIVVTLKGEHQEGNFVSSLFRHGVHGFVCEPFSPDHLAELISVLDKKEDQQGSDAERMKGSVSFLIGDIITHLDDVSLGEAEGKVRGRSKKKLKEAAKSLQDINSLDPAMVEKLLLSKFLEAPVPKRQAKKVTKKKERIKEARLPGKLIEERISQLSLSTDKVLSIVNISKEDFNLLLEGKLPIDQARSQDLSRALGQSAHYWLNLQQEYDRYQEFLAKEAKKLR